MANRFNLEAQRSATRDASLYGSENMSEDSQNRASLASPDDSAEQSDYFDFGEPKRRPTYPFVPPRPTEARAVRSLSKASNGYLKHQKRRSKPPIPIRHVDIEPNLSGPPRIQHTSTMGTDNSAPFEDTAVWDQKAILSLDGGGIRGYSALLILQQLMKAIGRIEKKYTHGPNIADGPAESSYHPLTPLSPKPCMATSTKLKAKSCGVPAKTDSSPWLPCHYFDYVAGTSTGGLIGIMLGRLRMNVDDCISEYETLGAQVFGHSRKCHIRSPLFWPREKYNYKALERVVRDVVRRRVPKVAEFPGGRNFAFDENRCRTVVVAYQQQSKAGAEKPYLFRTYKNLYKSKDAEDRKLVRNPDMAHDIPIWQVARATSAAPTYFKPPVIDGLEYLDGGFGANNPCVEIYEEVRRMNNNSQRCVSIILSIGTGKNNEARRLKGTGMQRYLNFLNFARKWAADSEQTHTEMLRAKSRDNLKYFRLNVESGLDLMKLDEWRARGPLRTKIGGCIGKFKSFLRQNGQEGNKSAATDGQGAHVLEEKLDDLKIENGTIHLNGNGVNDHVEQFTDRKSSPGAAGNVSTAHLKTLKESSTKDLDQPNGHPSFIRTSSRELDLDTDVTQVPAWFQPRNRTLETIRKYTEEYLSHPSTIRNIEQCAEILVEGRRGRAKCDPQRWERACFGTWYQCKVPECPRGEKEYESREQMRKHLLHKHTAKFIMGDGEGKRSLEEELDFCKIVVY